MTDYLGILWIVWVVIIVIAILLAIRRARRAIGNRNASQTAAYTVYSSPGTYPPQYVVGNNSTGQSNPLSPMYYGSPYPEPPLRTNATPSSSAYQKPDSSSVIDIPPPSYQEHAKDLRLPKPV